MAIETEPDIVYLAFSTTHLTVELEDGRNVCVPLKCYPRLLNASTAERRNWKPLGRGYGIEWPDLDEHIGVDGLMADRASGESVRSLKAWLASRERQKKKKTTVKKRQQNHDSR